MRQLSTRAPLLRRLAIIGLISSVGGLFVYAIRLHGGLPLPLDGDDVPLGRDFLNTWFYGRSFYDVDPGRFYDHAIYRDALQAMFPHNIVDHIWSYPPPFLLLAAPFGLLPYWAALASWTAAGVTGLVVTARAQGATWVAVAVILGSPVVLSCVIFGQVSLFCAVVILGAFAAMDRRPILAGLLIALLVVKPQTGLLFPVLLIASRRWTTLAAACCGLLAITIVSVATSGLGTWIDFLTIGLPSQVAEMRDSVRALSQVSVTMTTAATLFGLPHALVTALQAIATTAAIILVAYTSASRDRVGRDLERLMFLTCAAFASPYQLVQDLVVLTTAATLMKDGDETSFDGIWLIALLYMPTAQIFLEKVDLSLAVFVPIGFAIVLLRRVARSRAPSTPAENALNLGFARSDV